MTDSNIRTIWSIAKKQTMCWVATSFWAVGLVCFALSKPPHHWSWLLLMAMTPALSIGIMWFCVVQHAMRQNPKTDR